MAFHMEAIWDHNAETGKHAEQSGLAVLKAEPSGFGEDEET